MGGDTLFSKNGRVHPFLKELPGTPFFKRMAGYPLFLKEWPGTPFFYHKSNEDILEELKVESADEKLRRYK
jgi:hypothetical protein